MKKSGCCHPTLNTLQTRYARQRNLPNKTNRKHTMSAAIRNEANSKPRDRRLRSNLLMKLVIMSGVGALGGFWLFYSVWETQCSDLLNQAQIRHSAVIAELQELHTKQTSALQNCVEGDATKEKALAERLKTQSTLVIKHHDLLQQYDEAKSRIARLEVELEGVTQTNQSLNEQLERLQNEVAESARSTQGAEKQIVLLRTQLEATRSVIKQSCAFNETIDMSSQRHKEEVLQIYAAIQRQSFAQLFQRFGEGPYEVEFLLSTESTTETVAHETFRVELLRSKDMPHTVLTFLSLVELRLYDGTTIAGTDGTVISGGIPKQAQTRAQSYLMRMYVEHGFGFSPLVIEETSPTMPCMAHTFGFTERGPGFIIPLESMSKNESPSCPGRISSGRDVLERLARDRESQLTIIEAKLVSRDIGSHDTEL